MAIEGRDRGYLDDDDSGVREAVRGGAGGRGAGKMVAPPVPDKVPLDRLLFQTATRHRFVDRWGHIHEIDTIVVPTRAWPDYKESRDPSWSGMPTPLGLTVAVRIYSGD